MSGRLPRVRGRKLTNDAESRVAAAILAFPRQRARHYVAVWSISCAAVIQEIQGLLYPFCATVKLGLNVISLSDIGD